jgi:hypothetical protein
LQQEEKYSFYDGAAAFRAFAFNFFPSCCWDSEYNIPPLKKNAPPFTFNSFPVAAAREEVGEQAWARIHDFQFFPSCSRLNPSGDLLREGFQFFPSCSASTVTCCSAAWRRSFNSFPVAADPMT